MYLLICSSMGSCDACRKVTLLGEKGKDLEILVPVGVSVMVDGGKALGKL